MTADGSGVLSSFRFALDASAPTVTTGGWAKHVTVRRLPIACGISGVHIFLDSGVTKGVLDQLRSSPG